MLARALEHRAWQTPRIDDRLHGHGAAAARLGGPRVRPRNALRDALLFDDGIEIAGACARDGALCARVSAQVYNDEEDLERLAARRRRARASLSDVDARPRPMLRLTELRLPLEHPSRGAACRDRRPARHRRCGLRAIDRRSSAATTRASERAIVFVYTVDCEVARRGCGARRATRAIRTSAPRPTCATGSSPIAPADFAAGAAPRRPVVIGFGPCGIFAALLLAQMGLRPHRPRARPGGARAHAGHLGPVAARRPRSRNRTCSSARAAPARSPTASSGARSATRAT